MSSYLSCDALFLILLSCSEKDLKDRIKEIKPVHPKGNQSWIFFRRTDAEAEASPDAKSWLICKDPDAGRDWEPEEKGTTEDEMVGWHHWLNGRESEWTPGVGDGQGGLACCDSGVAKSWARLSDWNELNWTELMYILNARVLFQIIINPPLYHSNNIQTDLSVSSPSFSRLPNSLCQVPVWPYHSLSRRNSSMVSP